ncbi:MAG: metallophosphoesterase [Candidatus Aenigmarchaeota archaeon]|nr:metallophosphoesterase [Candidatus Aenigmarchaeota archaeon]
MKAAFVRNEPAIKIDSSLVIADLHIGITRDIWEKGISLPSQVSRMAERVNSIKKRTRTSRLVILGDVKHRIPVASFQEEREVPDFLSLVNFRKIVIVKGNHDGEIEGIVGKIPVRKSLSIGRYCLTHGHRKVATKKNMIIIGHNQPHVKLKDEMGAIYVEPAWVQGIMKDGRELTIMPAFNELCGASIVNEQKFIGPIAKNLLPSARVYLLDGTDLGTIDRLPRFERK